MKVTTGHNIHFYPYPWTFGWKGHRSIYWGWLHVSFNW